MPLSLLVPSAASLVSSATFAVHAPAEMLVLAVPFLLSIVSLENTELPRFCRVAATCGGLPRKLLESLNMLVAVPAEGRR